MRTLCGCLKLQNIAELDALLFATDPQRRLIEHDRHINLLLLNKQASAHSLIHR
jgi:hypothetical protein